MPTLLTLASLLRSPRLGAGARHKAANLCCPIVISVRPHYGRAKTVGLGYNRDIRYDHPLPINSHAILPILSIPVDIFHADAVGKGAAQAFTAREAVKPRLERRIGKSAVVTCQRLAGYECRQAKR